MKTDLATSIAVAIAGVVISYFVCNLFVGPIDDVSIKTVDASFSTEIAEPNPEVFNYRAINPTVEVYVGNDDNCMEFDDNGECIDGTSTTESSSSENTNSENTNAENTNLEPTNQEPTNQEPTNPEPTNPDNSNQGNL